MKRCSGTYQHLKQSNHRANNTRQLRKQLVHVLFNVSLMLIKFIGLSFHKSSIIALINTGCRHTILVMKTA